MTTPPPVQTPSEEAAEAEAAEEAPPAAPAPAEAAAEGEALLQIGAQAVSTLRSREVNRMRVVYTQTLNAMLKDPEVAQAGRTAFIQESEDPVAAAEDAGTADNLAAFIQESEDPVAAAE